jgi:hypothetical protein
MKKSIAFLLLAGLAGSASAATYTQDFNSFADGTTDLGDGTSMQGASARVEGGALRLNIDGQGLGFASFNIPALANSSSGFTVSFDLTITDSAGANPPADGFSFNYGNFVIGQLGAAEEGMRTVHASENLSFEIDTWMNNDTEQGVNISGNAGGADVGQLAFNNGPILNDGTSVSTAVNISWNPTDGASFSTDGLLTDANFSNVATTFAADDSHLFGFSGRVGGANQTVLIDNLVITTIPEPSGLALLGLSAFGFLLRRRR